MGMVLVVVVVVVAAPAAHVVCTIMVIVVAAAGCIADNPHPTMMLCVSCVVCLFNGVVWERRWRWGETDEMHTR